MFISSSFAGLAPIQHSPYVVFIGIHGSLRDIEGMVGIGPLGRIFFCSLSGVKGSGSSSGRYLWAPLIGISVRLRLILLDLVVPAVVSQLPLVVATATTTRLAPAVLGGLRRIIVLAKNVQPALAPGVISAVDGTAVSRFKAIVLAKIVQPAYAPDMAPAVDGTGVGRFKLRPCGCDRLGRRSIISLVAIGLADLVWVAAVVGHFSL